MEHMAVGMAVHRNIQVVHETRRALHALIAGDRAWRPRRSRAIIAKPPGWPEKHQRGPKDMERGWCQVGAWARLSVAAGMLSTLG